jgi:hypothetical protein
MSSNTKSKQKDEGTQNRGRAETSATPKTSKASPHAWQLLPPEEHDRWDAFVGRCREGTLFHTAWWYRAWGMTPTVQVATDKSGAIEAGICYCVGRRFGTRAIVRPPLTPRNGPLYSPLDSPELCKAITHGKQSMMAAIHALPKMGVYDFLLRACDTDVMPFLWNGFDALPSYTYVIPQSTADVWVKKASGTAQRKLRDAAKAAANGCYVLDPQPPMADVLALVGATASLKQYCIRGWQEHAPQWWQTVCQHAAGKAYVARGPQGDLLAANLMVYDGHAAYDVAGGMRNEGRGTSLAGVFLLDRMIRDTHAMGLDFDFEGSVLPGVELFMRRFGGELRRSYRVVKLPSLRAYLVWQAYRYWTGHRLRSWVWHD